jgi:FeS assembly SUF system protein
MTTIAILNKVELQQKIIDALKTIFDPEIPVNIYDLGLIYAIDIDDEAHVEVKMTLTSPGCPVAQSMPLDVKDKVYSVEGVSSANVELVWDPPWTMENLSEEAKLQLGIL